MGLYNFERAPGFVLTIRGDTIGRLYRSDVRAGGARWVWMNVCAMPWGSVEKRATPLGGEP